MERVVKPLELFFDLVYVFAIGQLSPSRFRYPPRDALTEPYRLIA